MLDMFMLGLAFGAFNSFHCSSVALLASIALKVSGEEKKMVTTSLLKLNVGELLMKVEKLTGVKFPRDIIEVSLEPKLNMLCIRFKKPSKAEFGEPLHHGIHLYTDKDTKEITAIEIIDLDKL